MQFVLLRLFAGIGGFFQIQTIRVGWQGMAGRSVDYRVLENS